MKDKRYTIHLEYCGQSEQKHVLRFCGEFVSWHDFRPQAITAAALHNSARFKL